MTATRYFTQTLRKQSGVPNTKYFIYCRKSTDEIDKQVLSIESQISELQELALKENFKIIDLLTENKTAKVPGREIFNKMLDRIEKGEADGILSWHPDRLARNSVDGGRIIYLIDTEKLVSLKFPTFWFEPTPQGKFMLSIAFGQSKYYVDNLSENIKRGNRQKLRNGVWPSKAPIGYFNEPIKRTIEVDENNIPFVRLAFELYSKGNIGLVDLTKKLSKAGFRNRKTNLAYKVDTIRAILGNSFYIGLMKYNGECYEGSHIPIISKELFDKVQEVLNKKTFHIRKRQNQYPFTGLMICGDCGASITAETQRGHHYYHCTYKKGRCVQRKYTRQEEIEKQLRKALFRVSIPDYWKDKFLKRLEKEGKWEKQRHKVSVKRELFRLNEVDDKLNKLLDGYLNGVISQEQYRIKQEELIKNKAKIKEIINKLEKGTAVWLEQMKDFINDANTARNVSQGYNLEEIADFAKKAGSNITLKDKIVSVSLKNLWNLAAHAAARRQFPKWWTFLEKYEPAFKKIRNVVAPAARPSPPSHFLHTRFFRLRLIYFTKISYQREIFVFAPPYPCVPT